jgi:hypothetical protein
MKRTREQKLDAIAKIICDWPNASSNDKRNARITAAAVLANLESVEEDMANGFPSGTVQSEVRVPSDQSLGIGPMDRRRTQRPGEEQARRRRSWRP